jgi:uncharacterized membrane protein
MRNFRKNVKVGVLILVAALAVAQAIRPAKTNPPARMDVSLDPAIKPLMQRACYNCHSNETVWPWYSNVAPVSWLLASDVQEARMKVNFSEWETYPADIQGHKRYLIGEEVGGKAMPPWYYSVMHRDSRLSAEERAAIIKWASAVSGH